MNYRAVVDYQVFGEGPGGAPLDPKQWLDEAVKSAMESGDIKAYSGEFFAPGPFGMYYVLFTVDIETPESTTLSNLVDDVLTRILGENDYSIRFVSAA